MPEALFRNERIVRAKSAKCLNGNFKLPPSTRLLHALVKTCDSCVQLFLEMRNIWIGRKDLCRKGQRVFDLILCERLHLRISSGRERKLNLVTCDGHKRGMCVNCGPNVQQDTQFKFQALLIEPCTTKVIASARAWHSTPPSGSSDCGNCSCAQNHGMQLVGRSGKQVVASTKRTEGQTAYIDTK